MYAQGVAQYMLNDVLCNPGLYINGYSVCVRPLSEGIQDIPEVGVPTFQEGTNIRFSQIFPQTA